MRRPSTKDKAQCEDAARLRRRELLLRERMAELGMSQPQQTEEIAHDQ